MARMKKSVIDILKVGDELIIFTPSSRILYSHFKITKIYNEGKEKRIVCGPYILDKSLKALKDSYGLQAYHPESSYAKIEKKRLDMLAFIEFKIKSYQSKDTVPFYDLELSQVEQIYSQITKK